MQSVQTHCAAARQEVAGGSVYPWIVWMIAALAILAPALLVAFQVHGFQLPDGLLAAPYFVT